MKPISPDQILRFDPAVEQPAADEAATNAAIVGAMRGILQTTLADYGHSVRSVHAKSHALLQGELHVHNNLPPHLAQGAFAKPGSKHTVVLRFSTNPGDILDDTVSTPRGLAIKILGVSGDRLPDCPGDTQDFVMVNGPAFVAPDAKAFSNSLKMLAGTTDSGQIWKKAASAVLRNAVAASRALGGDLGPLKALGGHPMTHPLGETFYTQTPFRYGNAIAKLSIAPASAGLRALKDAPVDLAGKPNGLRESLIAFFRDHDAEWELRVQLRTDPRSMPVEDASVVWPESQSPYVTVGTIRVTRQPAWSEARAAQADDGLAFSPWHGLVAHQPLGSVNRARRDSYKMSAGFRGRHNGCPMHEPTTDFALSADPATTYGTTPGREGRRMGTPDARKGAWSQPMNPLARGIVAGSIGGLAAGLLISAVMLGMEAAADQPSELVQLKRRTARQLGSRQRFPVQQASLDEQLLAHGGHLALSVASGAIYGAIARDTRRPLLAGTTFGAGFYALAYGLVGPVIGVSPRLWRDSPGSIAQHGSLHVMFGLVTAWVARRVSFKL